MLEHTLVCHKILVESVDRQNLQLGTFRVMWQHKQDAHEYVVSSVATIWVGPARVSRG